MSGWYQTHDLLALGRSEPDITITSGATTVNTVNHEPNEKIKPRPVGFTAHLETEVEPQLWDGDDG